MEKITTDIVVLGAGQGGYSAAFYAAEKGKKVLLVEKEARLGGVCLNAGCIPSKALIHAALVKKEAARAAEFGLIFSPPQLDLKKMNSWKDSILGRLDQGIRLVAKARRVEVLAGRGYLEDSHTLRVETGTGQKYVQFEKAILAVGSKSLMPKEFDLGNPRIMSSTEALALEEIPEDLLVVGGGYIGLELGGVYAALGSRVVVVEALDSILTGVDADLLIPVQKMAQQIFKEVRLNTKVGKMSTQGKKIKVQFDGAKAPESELYDRVLVAIGRAPNCSDLGLNNTAVTRGPKGYIEVNESRQTKDASIYAIGDVAGGILLAHKAYHEAKVAVDAICGEEGDASGAVIPAVVFTDPEVAWCGLTENDAKKKDIPVHVERFPWAASGRALTLGRTDGLTKLVIEPVTGRILGVGIVGNGAGELISEGVLAVEMAATVEDLAHIVHPHPTLSETIKECAEKYLSRRLKAAGS